LFGELGIPKPTEHKVLYKKIKLHAYKIQLLHEMKPPDKPTEPVEHMLEKTDNELNFTHNIMFADEATIHIVNGCIN
jgi:hypothetical protein